MFCDELKIKAIGGRGGNGCKSFRREKFVPKGGPDGGDGGNGGDIIIKANKQLNTLGHLANRKNYKAIKGVHGKGKKMHGKNAPDLILEVPEGTIVFNADKSQLLADLQEHGSEIILARGGKGGLGNARFVSSIHQAPRFAETGEPGEEKEVIFELKLVADVGIMGLPSAGKSTLISVISNAKPKIAAYHFTTLTPNLGVVDMSKFGGSANDSFVIADIPGLIEGASAGKGLGHEFLKHISRTELLVHVIDGFLDDVAADYKTIRKELEKFDKDLSKKEEIIVLNKIDVLDEKAIKEKLTALRSASKKRKIFTISAVTREGLQDLLFEISKKLLKIKKEQRKEVPKVTKTIPILRPHLKEVKFEVEKVIRKKSRTVFRISGKRIEQIIVMTDIKNREGLERVYHFFNKMGINKAVQKRGAKLGDIIRIKSKDIPYRP